MFCIIDPSDSIRFVILLLNRVKIRPEALFILYLKEISLEIDSSGSKFGFPP